MFYDLNNNRDNRDALPNAHTLINLRIIILKILAIGQSIHVKIYIKISNIQHV